MKGSRQCQTTTTKTTTTKTTTQTTKMSKTTTQTTKTTTQTTKMTPGLQISIESRNPIWPRTTGSSCGDDK